MKAIFVGCSEEQLRFGCNTGDPSCLIPGAIYEVVAQEVHSCHTKYYLDGYEGSFNSVCFELMEEANGR